METLRAHTFKDSHDSFTEVLIKHGFEFRCHMPHSGVAMASGFTIEIVLAGGWGALAVACLAWAHAQRSRRINVITKDKHSVWLEGYSADDAAKILQAAAQFSAIETAKPDKIYEKDGSGAL